MAWHTISRGVRLCAALWVGSVCGLASAQTIELKPKFEAGWTGYIESTEEIEQSIKGPMFGEEGQTTKIKQINGLIEKVESVAPGKGARISLTYDRVMQAFDSAQLSAAYDSDVDAPDDKGNMFAEVFSPMIGMPLMLELDESLKATSLTGMKEIVEKIEKTAGSNQFFGFIKAQLTDENSRFEWGDTFYAIYPNKAVKVGESWKKTLNHEDPQLGKLVIDFDVKLAKVDKRDGREMARIEYTYTLKQDPASKPEPGPMGFVTKIESSEYKGDAEFDTKLGQIVEQESKGSMKLTFSNPDDEKADGDQAPRITISSNSKRELKTLDQRAKEKAEHKKEGRKANG
jgi:hypothetical protein